MKYAKHRRTTCIATMLRFKLYELVARTFPRLYELLTLSAIISNKKEIESLFGLANTSPTKILFDCAINSPQIRPVFGEQSLTYS